MTNPAVQVRLDRLFAKACEIQEGRAHGLWLPIVWHLALRHHAEAMTMLAHWIAECDGAGRPSDPYSPFGLCRRAHRLGNENAAQNLAMDCFNSNDLNGYRTWLRRSARMGDLNSARELNCFETRLSHSNARRIGRLRPLRRWEKG